MYKVLLVSGLLLILAAPAHGLSWTCTCRDAEANDIGSVTVGTGANGTWQEAVIKANAECKRQYQNAVDGANCDSE